MPIYEYVCSNCQRKFRKLVGVVATPSPLECPKCRSTDVNKLISRFSRVRSEDEAMDAMADDMEAIGDSDDPKALRSLMRRMGSELGEDMDQEFEQMMEEETSGGGPADDFASDGAD